MLTCANLCLIIDNISGVYGEIVMFVAVQTLIGDVLLAVIFFFHNDYNDIHIY